MTDNDDKPIANVNARPTAPASSDHGSSVGAEATPSLKGLTDEDADLGNALRAIYKQTIEEKIPDEMLDLLKRLG